LQHKLYLGFDVFISLNTFLMLEECPTVCANMVSGTKVNGVKHNNEMSVHLVRHRASSLGSHKLKYIWKVISGPK
jgi:hypothetical protein